VRQSREYLRAVNINPDKSERMTYTSQQYFLERHCQKTDNL
jgi:hypothetical protein